MINETINLKEYYLNLDNEVYLTSYCPDNFAEFSIGKTRKCLLVLPGGGYMFLSDREAEPVCLRFAGYDLAVFLLRYTIYPKIKHPAPLEEVLAAVSYIRNNADKYHVNPNSISVMGFSAGGHLAASASCYYDDQEILNKLGLTEEDTKINGCFLCYPVISLEVGHEETFMNVSGGNKELLHKYSIEKNVSDKFPRTFIFHTTIDSIVNVENSLMLASKLHDHNIPFEMHIYPYCDHGLSLADSSVYPNDVSREYLDEMKPHSEWPRLALEFIKRYL